MISPNACREGEGQVFESEPRIFHDGDRKDSGGGAISVRLVRGRKPITDAVTLRKPARPR